jgi:RNA polymerase sigma-70 factor (ECF subfamily)
MVPIVGVDRVARLFATLGRQMTEAAIRIELRQVNRQPGAMVRDPDGRLINVYALDIAGGAVRTIRSVINPDKLHHLGPVADARAVVRRVRRARSAEPPPSQP